MAASPVLGWRRAFVGDLPVGVWNYRIAAIKLGAVPERRVELGDAVRQKIHIHPKFKGEWTMTKAFSRLACIAATCALAFSPAMTHAQEAKGEAKLPDAVKKTFDAKFPKAKIEKVDVEKENGVEVYDFEFRDGKKEKETDIAADGTMLEYTIVIPTKDVPEEAMKPIQKAAEGATMGRTEKIKVSYELKDGKIIKLPKPVMQYAVEMTKDGKNAEITVDAQGKVVEAPKWVEPKAKKTAA